LECFQEQLSMKNQPPGHTGRHFLQIPGPTNVPDRVLQAIAFPTIPGIVATFATCSAAWS